MRRVAASLVIVAATCAIAIAAEPAPSAPPDAVVGCWSIVTSTDGRYSVGQRLCLQPDAFVVLSTEARVADAWEVTWAATKGGWRATVPPAHTDGVDVHFDVARAGDGELALRSGAGWLDVRLGKREPVRASDAVARLRECRACVARAPQASGFGPVYALKECKAMASALGCGATR